MDRREIEEDVRRRMAEKDLIGLFPLWHRIMMPKTKRQMRSFVTAALEAAEPETLATLYGLSKGPRGLLAKAMAAHLADRKKRNGMHAVIRRLIVADAPHADELRATLARSGHMDVEELRQCLRPSGAYRLERAALYALVKAKDHTWLEARVEQGDLDGRALASLVSAAENDDSMAKRLVRLADTGDDTELLALVCGRFDVGRSLVEKALASGDPRARKNAMRHVHRLRAPTAALAEALTDPDTGVRRAALAHLVSDPDPELRPYVEALVDDPDPYDERYNASPVSLLAKRYLQAIGPTS